MKIVIVYDTGEQVARSIHEALIAVAGKKNDEVVSIDVNAATPKPCIGCFRCWHTTPGVCIHHNDAGNVFVKSIWNADYLLFVTRIQWGGYSSSVKSYADRIIPILHPYFHKVNGEMHHRLRYGKIPTILAAGFGARSADEEQTFNQYTKAHRDQGGSTVADGTFIFTISGNSTAQLPECATWFEKETTV
jgi:multimeric flavodoxin WrbA